MPEFTLCDFIDNEAAVGPEEDEEDEEEFDDLFDDEDTDADSTSEQGNLWCPSPSPTPSNFAQEVVEVRAHFTRRTTGASVPLGDPLLYHLVPQVSNPSMYYICVKPGYESQIVLDIAHRTITVKSPPIMDITTAFAREGIPGLVFLEGELPEVAKAVRGIYNVLSKFPPCLVPLEQHVALLMPHNLLSGPIEVGHWVKCLHSLYRNDLGFICGRRPYRDVDQDAETIVALVPRIPEKTDQTAKQKRGSQPEQQIWSCEQLEVVWGPSQVQRISGDEYKFSGQNYESGLVLMPIPSASLKKVDTTPNDLGPFFRASFIHDMPTFLPWVHQLAQDSIKPGQWVKVESGDHRGAIGKPADVVDVVASLALMSMGHGHTILQIPLCILAPLYRCGDNVKCRWSNLCGLITSVNEVKATLTFVKQYSNINITLPIDAVEPYNSPPNFFHLMMGTWVEFTAQMGGDQSKQRSYVKFIEGTYTTVFDEHSFAEFKIETRDLEISRTQAPSLPKNNLIHPLMGQRVVVISGPFKGLYSNIKEVGVATMDVELTALLVGASSPRQSFTLHELMIVCIAIYSIRRFTNQLYFPRSKELELARTSCPEERRTPSPGPPPRFATPDPTGHWLHKSVIQSVLEWNTLPFIIRTHGDQTLNDYEGKPARILPINKRTVTPCKDEVVVRTMRRNRPIQISITPGNLDPWDPLVGCEVIVTGSLALGTVGKVKEEQGYDWVVTFMVGDDTRDLVFTRTELAILEDLKQ